MYTKQLSKFCFEIKTHLLFKFVSRFFLFKCHLKVLIHIKFDDVKLAIFSGEFLEYLKN